jgi:hypothetical protein
MQGTQGTYRNSRGDITNGNALGRRAVGYIRVSTDMQAADGLSRRTRRLNSTAR